jgi:septal ring factor EnvC (AmiA/AmiB activator)
MSRIEIKNKLFTVFTLSIILLFPLFISAQSNNGNKSSKFEIYPVKQLTSKLKKDINLTHKQAPEVMSVLREYEAETYEAKGDISEVNEAANDAQDNISDILTKSQKSEWQTVKGEWWKSVDKELNLSHLSMINNNSNQM